MSDDIDFTQDKTALTEEGLKTLIYLANTHQEYLELLNKHIKQVENLTKRIYQIASESIPSLMQEMGVADYTLEDGSKITIKEVIKGSIPTITGITKAKGEQKAELHERRFEALNWLRGHGGSSIIKNLFSFDLGKDNEEAVGKLKKVAEKIKLPWTNDESVHAATLNSFLKEKIEKGKDDVPFNIFSIFTGKIAKITQPKRPIQKIK